MCLIEILYCVDWKGSLFEISNITLLMKSHLSLSHFKNGLDKFTSLQCTLTFWPHLLQWHAYLSALWIIASVSVLSNMNKQKLLVTSCPFLKLDSLLLFHKSRNLLSGITFSLYGLSSWSEVIWSAAFLAGFGIFLSFLVCLGSLYLSNRKKIQLSYSAVQLVHLFKVTCNCLFSGRCYHKGCLCTWWQYSRVCYKVSQNYTLLYEKKM